jgi:hypothetical protein
VELETTGSPTKDGQTGEVEEMRLDWLGNPITVSLNATAAAVNDFIEGALGYEAKAVNILEAAVADKECYVRLNHPGEITHEKSIRANGRQRAGRGDLRGPGGAKPDCDA